MLTNNVLILLCSELFTVSSKLLLNSYHTNISLLPAVSRQYTHTGSPLPVV